jgi:hypothetical protein
MNLKSALQRFRRSAALQSFAAAVELTKIMRRQRLNCAIAKAEAERRSIVRPAISVRREAPSPKKKILGLVFWLGPRKLA